MLGVHCGGAALIDAAGPHLRNLQRIASNVSNLKIRRPALLDEPALVSKTWCMRLPRTDIDMPSGVWVAAIERHVDKPTATDFQPPLNPRWLAALT